VQEFGGDRAFLSPFAPEAGQVDGHSFVSGHASVGFYFFGFALLSRRRRWLLLPVIAGSVIGATRIAQGGHFASDVLFSGWVEWYFTIFLYALFATGRFFHSDAELADSSFLSWDTLPL
jgi:lipid A 4'-phosphatase